MTSQEFQLKKMAIRAKIFATAIFGTAAIIFAGAFFMQTISPAVANNNPATNYSTGKYMMTMSCESIHNQINWYFLVWNTETGKSRFYYSNQQEGLKPSHNDYQLPTLPL